MSFAWPRLGRFGSRHWRVWLCYYVAFVLIHVACFHGWLIVLTPNPARSHRPLLVHAAYAWGWVWINTNSGIYRQHIQVETDVRVVAPLAAERTLPSRRDADAKDKLHGNILSSLTRCATDGEPWVDLLRRIHSMNANAHTCRAEQS